MKITDLKCAILGQNPVARLATDAGLIGEDPTNVERVMLKSVEFYLTRKGYLQAIT